MLFTDVVNENYEKLSETDLIICKCILKNTEHIPKLTIDEFARKSLSSKSSVIRCAKKLGFSGYSELKNFLKWKNNADNTQLQLNFKEQVIQDTEQTLTYIYQSDWQAIYTILEKAETIYVFSTGITQQNQGKELRRLFLLLGKPVQIIPGDEQSAEFKCIASNIKSGDTVFLLSLSGENRILEGILRLLQLKTENIISVTNFKSNWLSGHSTYNLYATSTLSNEPKDWWVQAVSPFFVLLESFVFGYIDYLRKRDGLP